MDVSGTAVAGARRKLAETLGSGEGDEQEMEREGEEDARALGTGAAGGGGTKKKKVGSWGEVNRGHVAARVTIKAGAEGGATREAKATRGVNARQATTGKRARVRSKRQRGLRGWRRCVPTLSRAGGRRRVRQRKRPNCRRQLIWRRKGRW